MSKILTILFVGDIVGEPGRRACEKILPRLRDHHSVDCIIANAENAAHGSGLTRKIVDDLFAAGVNVITVGDHAYKNPDVYEYYRSRSDIVRPANLADDAIGARWAVFTCPGTPHKIAVISLLGHVFIQGDRNPFQVVDGLIDTVRRETPLIFLDMHAEATSEKIAMGWYCDGKLSAVCGTHTHVQTADERILPKGTAYITDVGMTGPFTSVIGREIEPVLTRFRTSMPVRFTVAKDDVRLSGVLVTLDALSGRALSIARLHQKLGEMV